MSAVGTYLLRLTAAALICGMITALFGKKGAVGGILQLLAGVFLTIHILSPLAQISLDGWQGLTGDISVKAEAAGNAGENEAREAMAKRIREQTEAYILDKAQTLQAELTVEVILDDSAIPVPCGVRIDGNISPYAKGVLKDFMEKDLGIPAEEQIWT